MEIQNYEKLMETNVKEIDPYDLIENTKRKKII